MDPVFVYAEGSQPIYQVKSEELCSFLVEDVLNAGNFTYFTKRCQSACWHPTETFAIKSKIQYVKHSACFVSRRSLRTCSSIARKLELHALHSGESSACSLQDKGSSGIFDVVIMGDSELIVPIEPVGGLDLNQILFGKQSRLAI